MSTQTDLTVGVNPGVRVEVTEDAVLIRHGDHTAKLAGGRLPAFTEALLTVLSDGRTALDVGADTDEARLLALESVLNQLVDAGLLQRDDAATDLSEVSPAATGMWLRVLRNVPLRTVQDRMDRSLAVVLGKGALAERISRGLAEAGVTVRAAADRADVPPTNDPTRDVVVVVGETDRDPLLEEWNEEAVKGRRTWLPVVPFDGRRALVGPWTLPQESACFTCYQLRRAASFPDRGVIADIVAARPVSSGGERAALWPGLTTMQVGLVVERVVEWFGLTDTNAGLAAPGGLHTLEMTSDGIRLDAHRLFRVPRCPTCSPARDRGYPMIWFHPQSGIPLHTHDDAGNGEGK
ncbi:TOMM precursor leader peptide-binding protein [Allosalinactinospora lopnorensis]|uniref:TOMM precursor leader peptide-binding protein n=1 Tax=Allosalinactinospora lopnorensis TaxID=1352348 RepID=UPI000623C27A|nr:TOMM precursor leader peptide-binding protein [Allosalinactinospora lopnorensis]